MKSRSKSETWCSVNTNFNLKANATHNDLKNTILEFFGRNLNREKASSITILLRKFLEQPNRAAKR